MGGIQARIPILDADPELANTVPAEARERARLELVADGAVLEPGPWVPPHSKPEPGFIGFFVIDGVLIREVSVTGGSSIELVGGGALLRPWQEDSASFTIARWRVIGIVIGTLWVGSVLLGFAYNLLVI